MKQESSEGRGHDDRSGGVSRRRFLQTLGAGTAAFALGDLAWPKTSPAVGGGSRPPNFVLILTDDLGYGDLGCYGGSKHKTPNLDALAAEGLRFTDFHSNSPVCSPTRAALVTGRYQQRSGIHRVLPDDPKNTGGLALSEVTFAEVLKTAGYATGLFGKWHLGYKPEFNPTRQGFDEFRGFVSGHVDYHSHIDGAGNEDWWKNDRREPEVGYTTDLITNHAAEFVERNRRNPFCLYLAYESMHYPYQGPRDKAIREAGNPKPNVSGEEGDRVEIARAYGEMMKSLDDGIGRVAAKLRELGIEKDTFLFFTSDNGPAAPGSAAPLQGRKGMLLEGGHRVPGIAWWPGTIGRGVTSETAMTMDLFPTMAALAGAALPKGLTLDGADLAPLLLKGRKLPERTLFWLHQTRFEQWAVRSGPWKLWHLNGKSRLYNLDEDLGERNDLAARQPDRVRALEAAFKAWRTDVMKQ